MQALARSSSSSGSSGSISREMMHEFLPVHRQLQCPLFEVSVRAQHVALAQIPKKGELLVTRFAAT
jgi:hypothetical protein